MTTPQTPGPKMPGGVRRVPLPVEEERASIPSSSQRSPSQISNDQATGSYSTRFQQPVSMNQARGSVPSPLPLGGLSRSQSVVHGHHGPNQILPVSSAWSPISLRPSQHDHPPRIQLADPFLHQFQSSSRTRRASPLQDNGMGFCQRPLSPQLSQNDQPAPKSRPQSRNDSHRGRSLRAMPPVRCSAISLEQTFHAHNRGKGKAPSSPRFQDGRETPRSTPEEDIVWPRCRHPTTQDRARGPVEGASLSSPGQGNPSNFSQRWSPSQTRSWDGMTASLRHCNCQPTAPTNPEPYTMSPKDDLQVGMFTGAETVIIDGGTFNIFNIAG